MWIDTFGLGFTLGIGGVVVIIGGLRVVYRAALRVFE